MGADGEVLFGEEALWWQGQAAAVAGGAAAVAGGAAAVAWPNWMMAKLNGLGCLEGSPVIARPILCNCTTPCRTQHLHMG